MTDWFVVGWSKHNSILWVHLFSWDSHVFSSAKYENTHRGSFVLVIFFVCLERTAKKISKEIKIFFLLFNNKYLFPPAMLNGDWKIIIIVISCGIRNKIKTVRNQTKIDYNFDAGFWVCSCCLIRWECLNIKRNMKLNFGKL